MEAKTYLLITILLTLTFISCSKSYVGTFLSEKNSKNYIELKSDGSFYIQEDKQGFTGKFEVEDKTITFKTDIGVAFRGKIEKNIIIDPDGETWVKK